MLFYKSIDLAKLIKLPLREWGLIAMRAFFYYFLGVTLYTQAIILTKISNVAFIGAIPMTAILGVIILKEKISTKKAILVFISFLGVLIISVKDFSNILDLGIGELVAFLSTVFVALGLISRKWQSKELNDKEISVLTLPFAALFLFIGSILKGEGLPVHDWSFGIILALMLGGFLLAGVNYLMNYGFSRLDAVLAGSLISLEPFFVVLFAFLVFSEVPSIKDSVAGILIVICAILLTRIKPTQ